MDYLMNGEIYIKRGPTCISKRDDLEVEGLVKERFIDRIIRNINIQTGYEIVVPENIEIGSFDEIRYIFEEIQSLPDYVVKNLNKKTISFIFDYINYVLLGGNPNKRIAEEQNVIYDFVGCENFWQSFVINSKIVMDSKVDSFEPKLQKIYESKSDMDEDFIKLSEFLDKATYVGKHFKRTKPIKIDSKYNDNSYMSDKQLKYIVLYEYNDLFLTKEITPFGECYFIIDSRYLLDKNYILYGPTYEEYKDKSKLYTEIFKQSTRLNEQNNRKLSL